MKGRKRFCNFRYSGCGSPLIGVFWRNFDLRGMILEVLEIEGRLVGIFEAFSKGEEGVTIGFFEVVMRLVFGLLLVRLESDDSFFFYWVGEGFY